MLHISKGLGLIEMGSSRSDKAASHRRIVEIAAAHMRQDGIDGVRVAEVMSEAGLTHGGFYRHFESRDELISEALVLALEEGSERSRSAAENPGPRALRAVIKGYLSTTHRDSPSTGCAVAAMAEDVSRSNPTLRELFENQVLQYIELLERLQEATEGLESPMATLTLSAIVGAVNLARAVNDEELSLRILRETAESLTEMLNI